MVRTRGGALLLVAAITAGCAPEPVVVTAPGPADLTAVGGTGEDGFSGHGGRATAARVHGPVSLVFVGGDLYFADSGQDIAPTVEYYTRIRRIDAQGTITTIAGSGSALASTSRQASEIHFLAESHIAASPNGLYVTGGNPKIAGAYGASPHVVGEIDQSGGLPPLPRAGRCPGGRGCAQGVFPRDRGPAP